MDKLKIGDKVCLRQKYSNLAKNCVVKRLYNKLSDYGNMRNFCVVSGQLFWDDTRIRDFLIPTFFVRKVK